MGEVALLFSGQGAQYPGMGQDLYDNSTAAREVYDTLEAMRPGIKALCFSSTAEELRITVNTQPAMFATECAIAAALAEKGLTFSAVAGFSLGEIAALVQAGVVSLEDGFRIVCERARLMQMVTEKYETGMSAILKLSNEKVEELCSRVSDVYPVNYNCPGQVVVSGLVSSLPEFEELVKEAGGRAMRLAVSGGFHSPFMKEAGDMFAEVLKEFDFRKPLMPIYSNVTGQVYDGDMKELLSRQISSPVRWQTLLENMMAKGIRTFVESGPGTTLCGLVKKTDKTAGALSAATWQAIQDLSI